MLKTIELEIPAPFVDIVIELKPIMTAIYLSQRKNSVFSKTKWAGIALEFISVVWVPYPFDSSRNVTFPIFALVASLVGLVGITTDNLVQKTVIFWYSFLSVHIIEHGYGFIKLLVEMQDIT